MIIVIRIAGMVKINWDVQETLFRMRLRRKYAAVLLHPTAENIKLLQKVRNFVAFGNISSEMLTKLISARGVSKDKKKIDAGKIIMDVEKKGLDKSGLKPFFRLHPPRGGIESNVHFPKRKGVLGDHGNKIDELVGRML